MLMMKRSGDKKTLKGNDEAIERLKALNVDALKLFYARAAPEGR